MVASIISTFLINRFLVERISIIGSFVGFERAYNPGVAFSITFPPLVQGLLVCIALGLVGYLALQNAHSVLGNIAFGLIIGGALGNIIDRFPDGLVTDFMQVGTFPIFNIADSCISVGVGLLLVQAVVQKRAHFSENDKNQGEPK